MTTLLKTPEEKFLKLRHADELAGLLRIQYATLLQIADTSQESYREFKIPKRTGGTRAIESPSGSLKSVQKFLNLPLQRVYHQIRPECVHGFVPNFFKQQITRNIVSNASVHVGKKFVLNLDIENFFHAVSAQRVKNLLMCYPFYFGNDLASIIAILTTRNERLPMGAPTSPVLSNLASFMLDRKLMYYAKRKQLNFTRYADDLSFSSDEEITAEQVKNITGIIHSERFEINEKKTRILSKQGRQLVTGLKVNEKVNVDRKYIRSIRAMLHNWESKGLNLSASQNYSPQEFYNILKGKLSFLKMVKGDEDEIYRKFIWKFDELSRAYNFKK